MFKKEEVLNALLQQKLLPLYYHDSPEVSVEILRALYDAGIRTVEYTNRGDHALDNFKELRKAADMEMPDLQLGAGTIKSKKAAKKFMAAGADFIVCPTISEKVADAVHHEGLLWVPGCLTPTEISVAEEAGASLVKIFPANNLNPSYISAVKGIFPDLMFMPTGGVEGQESHLRSWFDAGIVAVGMGSTFISKEMIKEQNYGGVKTAAARVLQLIQAITHKDL